MKKFLMAGAALVALSTASQAATINGTAAVSVIGVSANTASIGVGTTFTNTFSSVVGSASGELSPGFTGTSLALSDIVASVGSAFSFTSVNGNFTGTVNSASASGASASRTVELYVLGTFTPTGTLGGFDAGGASATISFTQTGGPGAAVSASFTFATPPAPQPSAGPPAVPAPMSLALFGMGLAGLGLAVRARGGI